MTDPVLNNAQNRTAWTPGPWDVRDGTPEGGGQVWEITSPHAPDVNCNEVASSWENRPTAELIALAPEMAEAILAMADMCRLWTAPKSSLNEYEKGIADMAERLRAIGGDRA